MKKLIYASIVMLSIAGISAADETKNGILDIMVISKMTGLCGAIKQMAAFQESTKMPGGDEFLTRFLNTESSRLGKTLPEFLEGCSSVTNTYNQYYKVFEK